MWLPTSADALEVNFVGIDPELTDPSEAYVLADPTLPLLVFGQLSLLRPGRTIEVEGALAPLPRPAGLMLEKLLTDRSGVKGERDLLVVLAVLLQSGEDELRELVTAYGALRPDLRYVVRSNLTLLSLLRPVAGLPDPGPFRGRIADLLARLESSDDAGD